MKRVLISFGIVVAATSARAEIMCTQHGGCWETGQRIILVDPSFALGQDAVSHRNGKKQRVRINRIHWGN
jgi:hypothetical protein